ncbi:nitrite reductase [Zoogloea sp. LCSB751]|uniref:nitrite reductase n=1 Tax=Zoogloea sp. LCSB751 TaxID=1965277 RepID=UPI0009A51E77|nr:nitrite reductase [Zoogloea sp. LCSB751]
MIKRLIPTIALAALAFTALPAQAGTPELFAQHCASCHGTGRLGAMGPALLPDSLERLKRKDAVATIRDGRTATQMPPFSAVLSAAEIDALTDWIYSPVSPAPTWSAADIRASRVEPYPPGNLPDTRQGDVAKADPMNLFIVVEAGDHHVSVLDGDRMERIFRFPSRYALHGGPKFTPDGRYVFFASRDGWVSKFDIWNLKVVAEVRAGLNTRNAAVSSDGRYVAVANYLPGNLAIFDADLKLLKLIDGRNQKGDAASRISAVYDAAPRKSFVVGLKDLPEIWEISYDPAAKPFHDGYVHDYKMGEAISTPGYLNPRRTLLEEPLDDFFFTQDYTNVVGASRDGHGKVVNLDVRRPISNLDLPGMPHLGSGISWLRDGHRVVASTNLKDARVSVIDMQNWQTVATIPTLGPGFFLRSHENSPYAWVDSMMSPTARDTLQVIDKQSLQVVAQVRPEPGKTFAHVEFDRNGRYVIASLMEKDGALIFLDAKTFKEIKRLPASKPIGKYNLFNKIQRSEGTSH